MEVADRCGLGAAPRGNASGWLVDLENVGSRSDGMIFEMHQMLARVRSRLRQVRLWQAWALCWVAWALVGLAIWGAVGLGAHAASANTETAVREPFLATTETWIVLAAAAALTALACAGKVYAGTRDPHWVAHRIEEQHPELGASLLAALEQAPTPKYRRLGYLQTAVVMQVVEHGRRHDWSRGVPRWRIGMALAANLLALSLLGGVCLLLINQHDAAARLTKLAPDRSATVMRSEVEITPGDIELERGSTLLVVARFNEPPPAEVSLVLTDAQFSPTDDRAETPPATTRESAQEAAQSAKQAASRGVRVMTQSLGDPQFVARVPAVANDLSYHVQYAGQQSRPYRVTVFDYPALERVDAQLRYPQFTRLPPKRIEDVRNLTAVEGTEVTLSFRLNKPVQEARLVDRDGAQWSLAPAIATRGSTGTVYETTIALQKSLRVKLHLTDSEGRQNKLPPQLILSVTPNRPPNLQWTRPGKDTRVSPLEELDLAGEVSDDFGLLRMGVAYAVTGSDPRELVLLDVETSSPSEAITKTGWTTRIDFEALGVEPDQLLTYYAWAEDTDADGQPRRVMSDLYFAEVRPFEEIFREGEQPTAQQQREQQQGGQPGQGQQLEQLVEMQKQIVAATWTLLRRQGSDAAEATLSSDTELVRDSQQYAIDRLAETAAETQNAEASRAYERAREQMQAAVENLTVAAGRVSPAPLDAALAAEQAAYQELLKLRAREMNVVRGQPSGGAQGGSQGGGNRSQSQLEQLELSAEENRYETQSRALDARAQQSRERQQNESRELLDRLRELARRQEDLNRRVRELQSELQAAQSAAEQQRIERELKRLRDQQRQILRDTDQLQSDMQSSQNQQTLKSSQQQLDQTRQRVQEASDALGEGQLAEALTQGTRAQRELSDLGEEFRRQTAEGFSREMQDLRDAAQSLDEEQQQLSEELAAQETRSGGSLRDQDPQPDLPERIADQQRQFHELLDKMQQTVQEAQEAEPLLARQLYETAQQATDQQIDQALQLAEQMLRVGVRREAAEPMRTAHRGIGELRQGVERAAASVLGDQTEALRRAERELGELGEQLSSEIKDAPSSQPGQRPLGEQTQQDQQGQRGEPTQEGQPGRPGQQAGGPQQSPASEPSDQGQPNTPGSPAQPADRGRREQGTRTAQGGVGGAGGGGPEDLAGDLRSLLDGLSSPPGPITGDGFRDWDQRLGDVQELLDDRALRDQAARIRDRARAARGDFRRHSRVPDQDKLRDLLVEPLIELQRQVAEEIRRRESPEDLVPIDRDPVPADFADAIRRYYQRLGSGP
jgi:hypothetical protein